MSLPAGSNTFGSWKGLLDLPVPHFDPMRGGRHQLQGRRPLPLSDLSVFALQVPVVEERPVQPSCAEQPDLSAQRSSDRSRDRSGDRRRWSREPEEAFGKEIAKMNGLPPSLHELTVLSDRARATHSTSQAATA